MGKLDFFFGLAPSSSSAAALAFLALAPPLLLGALRLEEPSPPADDDASGSRGTACLLTFSRSGRRSAADRQTIVLDPPVTD